MQDQNLKTPDLSHRYNDYPQNNILYASSQIQTVLSFIYNALEDAQKPLAPHNISVERLLSDKKALVEEIQDALYIIDSLNRDVKAIAFAVEPTI